MLEVGLKIRLEEMGRCQKIINQFTDVRIGCKDLCQQCAAVTRKNTAATGKGLQNKGEEIKRMKRQGRTEASARSMTRKGEKQTNKNHRL